MESEVPKSSKQFRSTPETRSRYRDMVKREFPPLEPEELNPKVFPIPANYDSWKPIYRGLQEEGEDIGERLTNDPSLIDRI